MAKFDQKTPFEQLSGKLSNYQKPCRLKLFSKFLYKTIRWCNKEINFSDVNGPLSFFLMKKHFDRQINVLFEFFPNCDFSKGNSYFRKLNAN